MQIQNITNPGVAPVDGDFIRITYENGNVEEKHYWAPVVTVPTE